MRVRSLETLPTTGGRRIFVMTPPTGPGWGVDVNEELVRAHPIEQVSMFPIEPAEDGSIADL